MDNIKLYGMPTKMKWKNQACFALNFKFWEGTSVKSYKIQLPVFLFLVLFYISFYISRYYFYNFLEFHSALSGKVFHHKFSFLTDSTPFPQPHPLSGQSLLNVTKAFGEFSWWCLLNFFFFSKIYWQSPAKHFLKVPTINFLVFFSEDISRTAILTQAPVITCK